MKHILIYSFAVLALGLSSCSINKGTSLDATTMSRLRGAKICAIGDNGEMVCNVATMGEQLGGAALSIAVGVGTSSATGANPGVVGGGMGTSLMDATTRQGKVGVIASPARGMAEELVSALRTKYQMTVLPSRNGLELDPKMSNIAAVCPDADFALRVAVGCSALAKLQNPMRYTVQGNILFFLIDVKTGKVVCRGSHQKTGGSGPSPKKAELVGPGSPGFVAGMADMKAKAMPQFHARLLR